MGATVPAPFIDFANMIQLSARYLMENQPVENVFNIQGAGAWTPTTMHGASDAFFAWETAEGRNHRSSDVLFTGCHIRDMTTEAGAEIDTVGTISGLLVGPRLPNHNTFAVKAGTGLSGRSNRGRTFWIGLTQDLLDASDINQLSTAAVTAIVGHMDALIAVAWPNTGKLVVASRRTGGAPRLHGVTTPIITYSAADTFVDSQRRRLPGHNRHR